jgi:DNA processing protein
MDRPELYAWLRLLHTPLVGRETARRLMAAFGSPDAVFRADPAARVSVVGAAVAAALDQPPDGLEALLDATLAWCDAGTPASPRSLLSLGDADYPDALLQTADPPLLLHAQGQRRWLATPMIAIVGSRKPTPQGLDIAAELAGGLARSGWTVVSGLALGIDGAAHAAALDAGAPSIAVVGTGLDRVYPARHRALAHRLAEQGLLLSEFALGTPPMAGNFPQRNRIIAGLARGTVVVEAALRSGSLITARLAAECGREVFAVPGSIQAPQSHGCHLLIKQGAKLVESVDDVLEEFEPVGGPAQRSNRPPDAAASPPRDNSEELPDESPEDRPESGLLAALGHGPVSLDALLARTGMSVPALGAALLELELTGRVARLPGQLFQRVGQA